MPKLVIPRVITLNCTRNRLLAYKRLPNNRLPTLVWVRDRPMTICMARIKSQSLVSFYNFMAEDAHAFKVLTDASLCHFVPVASPPAPPAKSLLKPPKQAASAWQFFFTDRLNEAKATAAPGAKLNVAEVAKEAGAAYNELPSEEKEVYLKRAADARDAYKKEYAAWLSTLSPEEIKRENEFRAGQRKAGKSRKGNLKDPNAPKKPLSAYFLFLKAIRSNRTLTKIIFQDAEATTKQSTLAAVRWRDFTPEQKGPFLRQSEIDKAEHDEVRKQYETDNAARARGEKIPQRPQPKYSRENVSPRLLCAVLPDGTPEELEEVKKDAAAAAAEQSGAKANANDTADEGDDQEHAGDQTHSEGEGDSHAADTQVRTKDEPRDNAEDPNSASYLDMAEFVPSAFGGSEGLPTGQSHGHKGHLDSANTDGNNIPSHDVEHNGLDLNSVFQTTPPIHDVSTDILTKVEGGPDYTSNQPQVTSMSAQGVSADGSMSFSYSSTSMISGGGLPGFGLSNDQHERDRPAVTVEELPENASTEDGLAPRVEEISERTPGLEPSTN